MSSKIVVGSAQAAEKLTAGLYFKPTGDAGYVNFGNILDYKYAPERNFVKRMISAGGARRVTDQQLGDTHEKWEFTGDEMTNMAQRILHLAATEATANQSANTAPAGTASFTAVELGRTYFLGYTDVDTLVLEETVGPTTLVAGTDYTASAADLKAGIFHLLESASNVSDGESIDATFGNAAVSKQSWTGAPTTNANIYFTGDFKILEFNQHESTPLTEVTFAGIVNGTAFPEQSGEFGKFVLTVTATGSITKVRRYAA